MSAWPSYTFTVNLNKFDSEKLGPKTNSSEGTPLSPDQYQTSPDNGRTESSNRSATISTWIPGLTAGQNRALQHGDSFTVTGLQALYIRNQYGVGYAESDRAFLDVTVNSL